MSVEYGGRGAIPPDNTLAGKIFLRFQSDQARQKVHGSYEDPAAAAQFLKQFPHVGGDVMAERMAQEAGRWKYNKGRDDEAARAATLETIGGPSERGRMQGLQEQWEHLGKKHDNSIIQRAMKVLESRNLIDPPRREAERGVAAEIRKDHLGRLDVNRAVRTDTSEEREAGVAGRTFDLLGGTEGLAGMRAGGVQRADQRDQDTFAGERRVLDLEEFQGRALMEKMQVTPDQVPDATAIPVDFGTRDGIIRMMAKKDVVDFNNGFENKKGIPLTDGTFFVGSDGQNFYIEGGSEVVYDDQYRNYVTPGGRVIAGRASTVDGRPSHTATDPQGLALAGTGGRGKSGGGKGDVVDPAKEQFRNEFLAGATGEFWLQSLLSELDVDKDVRDSATRMFKDLDGDFAQRVREFDEAAIGSRELRDYISLSDNRASPRIGYAALGKLLKVFDPAGGSLSSGEGIKKALENETFGSVVTRPALAIYNYITGDTKNKEDSIKALGELSREIADIRNAKVKSGQQMVDGLKHKAFGLNEKFHSEYDRRMAPYKEKLFPQLALGGDRVWDELSDDGKAEQWRAAQRAWGPDLTNVVKEMNEHFGKDGRPILQEIENPKTGERAIGYAKGKDFIPLQNLPPPPVPAAGHGAVYEFGAGRGNVDVRAQHGAFPL